MNGGAIWRGGGTGILGGNYPISVLPVWGYPDAGPLSAIVTRASAGCRRNLLWCAREGHRARVARQAADMVGFAADMQSVSKDNFGPLIAYLVPGATALLGLSAYSPVLRSWFSFTPAEAPTIGGFLYLTLASLTAGMTVSAVRWLFVDTLHAWTRIAATSLNFSHLGSRVEAYALLIEIHYRHYQFHANMFVAVAFAYLCFRLTRPAPWWMDVAAVLIEIVFFVGSRDNLRKYYARVQQLLAGPASAASRRPTSTSSTPSRSEPQSR